MSQVRKYANGSMIIDGVNYEATPEFISALTQHLGNTAGTDAQTLAGLTNALQSGQIVTYDSASNTISGMSGLWGGVTDKQDERRKAGSSRWRKFWEAQLDTDAHRFRNALSALGTFSYQIPKPQEINEDLANIYGDKTWYEYNTGEDGSKTWLENSSTNIGIAKRLADMSDYLSDIEAGKKKYKLGEWYSPERIDALKGLYEKYDKDTWNNTIAQIGERAKANQLKPEDIAFLKNFNIVDQGDVTATTDGLAPQDRKRWTDAGHGDLISILGNRAHVNDDGSISLNDGMDWGWNLGDLAGRNIWFNDDFYNSRYGADGSFNPYRNYTLYNNRLYALDNPTLANILNAQGGFNDLMKAGNWSGADNEILTRFTDAARENPNYLANDSYSTFLSKKPTYRFSDLTGKYKTEGMLDNDQLIQYVDLSDNSLIGPYRNYGYKYAILDERGNLKTDNIDSASILEIPGGTSRQSGLTTYKQIVGNNNGSYNNRYYEDLFDSKGDATGFRIYTDKDDENDVILHMPEIKASGVTEQDIKLPKNLASLLFADKNIWDKIVGNAQNKKDFMRIISSLVRSGYRNSTLLGLNDRQLLNRIYGNAKAEEILKAVKEARSGSRSQRREDMLVTPPTIQKNGGILKEQSGGKAGGSKVSTGVTERKVNAINTNPKNAAAALGDSKNWTDADSADLGALITDIGSLILAFVPGANIGSAATGAAGSTARLYADLNRGTKGAGWNYALNLGMDAATLLPILGGGAKSLKIVKGVRAALPTIIKAASVYGLGAGVVDTAKKIASGEKFTVRDVDMLVNALTAGVGLGKSGGFGKGTKTTKVTEEVSIKNKAGDKTLSLTAKELEGVDTADKLIAKLTDKSGLSKEAFAEQYDVSSLLSDKKVWKPGLRPKNWTKTETQQTFNPKTSKVKQEVTPNGKTLHDWWYGVGEPQIAYNSQLKGETPTRLAAYELKRTDTNVYPTKPRVFRTKGKVSSKEIPMSEFKGRTFNEEIIPGGFTTLNQGPGMVQNPGTANYVGYFTKQINVPKRGIALPQWINPFTMANYQENKDIQPSGAVIQPLFKKGGKIEKAQLGATLNVPKLDIKGLGVNIKDKVLDNVSKMNPIPKFEAPTFTPSKPSVLDSKLANFKVVNPMTGKAVTDNKQSASSGVLQGTFSEQKWQPDLTIPMNWIRSLYAMKQSDNQLENFLNRHHYQMQDALLNTPRFVSSGKGDAYRALANTIRMSKPVTSDAMQNDLMQRQRQQDALNYELQGTLADSEEFGKYLAGLQDFWNNEQLRHVNVANQNAQIRWQDNIEDVQAKNANIAEKSKFFDQAAYATQDWYNRNWQMRNEAEAAKAVNKDLLGLDTWYRNAMLEHNKKYKDDLYGENAALDLAMIKSQLASKQQALGYSNMYARLAPAFKLGLLKKGGSVSSGKRSGVTYSRDPYPELLIQNSKDSAEAVKQLNDAVIKLLLQTKPINVH